MTRPKVKIGDVYNKLTVVERRGITSQGKALWLVRCDCEDQTEFLITSTQLATGKTKSCGCLRRNRNKGKATSKKDPLYSRWGGIIQRCTNENSSNYAYYGGRGITVDPVWKGSFLEFQAYVKKIHPNYLELLDLRYQIDRIDNNGNYEPGNIRLVTALENCLNKRPNQGPSLSRYVLSKRHKNTHDLTGLVFGELTAIKPVGHAARGIVWKVKCSCGAEKEVVASLLTMGKTKSCGHLRKVPPSKTHGLRNHPIYPSWARLKNRAKSGKIQVVEAWLDFPTFYAWAITQDWGNGNLLTTRKKGEVYGPDTCYYKPYK